MQFYVLNRTKLLAGYCWFFQFPGKNTWHKPNPAGNMMEALKDRYHYTLALLRGTVAMAQKVRSLAQLLHWPY